jgi:hypothetical protein
MLEAEQIKADPAGKRRFDEPGDEPGRHGHSEK